MAKTPRKALAKQRVDAQSGMETNTPPEDKKAETKAQIDEAQAQAEASLSRQIRGW